MSQNPRSIPLSLPADSAPPNEELPPARTRGGTRPPNLPPIPPNSTPPALPPSLPPSLPPALPPLPLSQPPKPASTQPPLPSKPPPTQPPLPSKPAPTQPPLPSKPAPTTQPPLPSKPAPTQPPMPSKPAPTQPPLPSKPAPTQPPMPSKPAPTTQPPMPSKPAPTHPPPSQPQESKPTFPSQLPPLPSQPPASRPSPSISPTPSPTLPERDSPARGSPSLPARPPPKRFSHMGGSPLVGPNAAAPKQTHKRNISSSKIAEIAKKMESSSEDLLSDEEKVQRGGGGGRGRGGGGRGRGNLAANPFAQQLAMKLGGSGIHPSGGGGGGGGGGSGIKTKSPSLPPRDPTCLDLTLLGTWIADRSHIGVILVENWMGDEEEGKKKKKAKPGKKGALTVYGMPLQDIFDESEITIPVVVLQSINYLKHSDGLQLEGIFRISAPIKEVDRLKGLYASPNSFVDLESETDNPHVVACMLKQFFTTMPEPLLPFDETDNLVKVYQENEEQIETMCSQLKEILHRIPQLSAILLRFLIEFLSHITIYSEKNFMTADNLAICFGPNLIRFKNASAAMMGSQIEAKIVAVMIKNYSSLFLGVGEDHIISIKEKKKKRARPISVMSVDPGRKSPIFGGRKSPVPSRVPSPIMPGLQTQSAMTIPQEKAYRKRRTTQSVYMDKPISLFTSGDVIMCNGCSVSKGNKKCTKCLELFCGKCLSKGGCPANAGGKHLPDRRSMFTKSISSLTATQITEDGDHPKSGLHSELLKSVRKHPSHN